LFHPGDLRAAKNLPIAENRAKISIDSQKNRRKLISLIIEITTLPSRSSFKNELYVERLKSTPISVSIYLRSQLDPQEID